MKFSKFQKIVISILCLLLAADLAVVTTIYRAFFVNPNNFTIQYKTIRDSRIPDTLNEASIVYITDLEINSFTDMDMVDSIFSEIDQLNPDVFLFGGDLFAADTQVDQELMDHMIFLLSSINAPLGKFAVFGEQDLVDENRISQVQNIFAASQIESLENSSVNVGNQSRSSIKLVGITPVPDYEAACASVNSEQYTLLLSHYPDNLISDSLGIYPISMALAGNAHGTQITWPIKGGYREWPGSIKLNRDKQKTLPFEYYLSSGLGCIEVDARLNAPVEVVYYLLSNT